MKPLPKKSSKSISNVRKRGVQIRGDEVFKLAGVHTNTYNTNTYCRRFIGKDTRKNDQITNCQQFYY